MKTRSDYFRPAMAEGRVVASVPYTGAAAPAVELVEHAFFGPVFRNTTVATGGIAVGSAVPETEAWARKVVIDSLAAKGYEKPTLGMMQIVQAVGRMEGFYGRASKPAAWAGSNNWGAVQQCVAKDGVCPDNTFASKDYNPDKAEDYIACFRKYPTPQAGCEDMLRIMTRTAEEKKAFLAGDVLAMSTAMYNAVYYQSRFKKERREEAIAWHAETMAKNIKAIREALGEPLGTGPSYTPVPLPGGDPVAPGVDLTPLLLGLLPFGFHAAKLLVHMVGDPLIVTPEMARDKIRDVDVKYNQTDDDYARAISKKKITLAAYTEWTRQGAKYRVWSEHKIGSTGDGISVASASADYETAKRYDLERFEYATRLEKSGLTPPDRPPEVKPPPMDPDGGTLGGGNILSKFGGDMAPLLAVGGLLALVMLVKR